MTLAPQPNLQLLYVTDIQRSTALYRRLFAADPVFVSPRYVAFSAGGEALFALWSGGAAPYADVPRFVETGIMLASGEAVDQLYHAWRNDPDLRIAEPPSTEVFGRTFLAQDPDGHRIRVCQRD
ncbi:catechol 2,3-dioxygenase-like lactoylglutathione lyase family enzyme [Chromobacterium alkanivorans]|uniref:VOC family protein n=1 Tax=Chromobacterium alkanivorans TaxID=1071719 RepID=UPI002167325C|nr:VOC family protein [Chromobacterium alkanivorans]MCS3804577.1 catechol 2,3-dioxygenase-like lactoylglutathione lyase family enzyme [Chromobacterium alkanivorans]MCS3818916.1 catechol 2,3-dioxygenase-like lactoylglutathione lyase family enzyme [Chromobacterium alkanivorans]MCS3873226.1 catechol 2,3-dioxygenase-like lactoylglutathione lyase family enzyme [Chromobacterium alkanivorans]